MRGTSTKRAVVALSVIAAALLFSCGPRAADTTTGTDPEWFKQAANVPPLPTWCVRQITVQPAARPSDLANMLAGNQVKPCFWSSSSKLIATDWAAKPTCNVLSAPNIEVVSTSVQARSPLPDESCPMGIGPVPQGFDGEGMTAVCYAVEPAIEPRYNSPSSEAVASRLIETGLLVRFLETQDGKTRIWVDMENYPWPDRFDENLQFVALRLGVTATALACE